MIARLQEESSLLREREAECERWKTEVEGLRVNAELECHRAVAAERQKWEAREEWMLEQQQLLEAARAARSFEGVASSLGGCPDSPSVKNREKLVPIID